MPRPVRLSLMVTAALLVVARLVYTWPWPGIHEDLLYEWRGHMSPELSLSAAEQAQAMGVVREALLSPFDAPADPPDRLPEVFSERDPREVWVGLFTPGEPMRVGFAKEANLYRSLRAATRAAIEPGGERRGPVDPSAVAVQIDVLVARESISPALPWRFFSIEPGVHGIHLTLGEADAWAYPSEALHRGWLAYRLPSRLEAIDALLGAVAARLEGAGPEAWRDAEIERFITRSFAQRRVGAPVTPLFRGNVLLEDVDSGVLITHLSLGGQWLLNQARADGTFTYAYKPAVDETPDEYNVVRHAGTVFGLLSIEAVTHLPAMLEAALKALPYLRQNIKPIGDGGRMMALYDETSQSSGAAALGLLSLLTLPEAHREPADAERLTQLGDFLLFNIDDRGKVFPGWRYSSKGGRVVTEPDYYPGEALLALARLYQQVPEARFLEGAQRIAARKMMEFRYIPGGWGDHWVMQGLAALWEVTGDRAYADALFAMADQSIDTQYPPNLPPWPDYLGMFRYAGAVPRATRVGSRSEAIRAAMHVAWALGRDAKRFEDSLILASKASVEQMFRPESAYWVRRPDAVLGGIKGGPLDDLLRIDFNQHGLVGMLGGIEAALHQEGNEAPWAP